MDHLRGWLGLSEEACGGDLQAVLFMLARCGLYDSNTMDLAKGEIWLGAETRLTAGQTLTAFLYGEAPAERADDEI